MKTFVFTKTLHSMTYDYYISLMFLLLRSAMLLYAAVLTKWQVAGVFGVWKHYTVSPKRIQELLGDIVKVSAAVKHLKGRNRMEKVSFMFH